LAGPSWQCEPLAPPDMGRGDWGTGRHLPLKFDAPWCPRVPRFELGPAIKCPGWARGETEGGCRLPPRLNTVVTHTALPSADSDVLVPQHLTRSWPAHRLTRPWPGVTGGGLGLGAVLAPLT
jgi:hypothetical protein